MAIYFYTTIDKYGCFSNFSRHGFELDGKYWPTAEHFFQAQKFVGAEHERHVAQARFETHQEIRDLLLATGDEVLVENAPGDFYWGCGADGTGLNKLGAIFMEVRSILRDRAAP